MARILVAGETLIDFVPEQPGPLPDVETFHRRAGGAPANVAVALARLDVPAQFWTRVGSDPFGEHLIETLAAEGVPDDFVEQDSAARTTLAFVGLDEDAEPTFTFRRDGTADTRLQPGTISDDRLSALEWVHTGGVTLASGASRDATFDLLDRAGEQPGTTVSFDPNARPELFESTDLGASIERALGAADVAKATAEDLIAADLVSAETEDSRLLAETICEYGPHTALVTRGADGAIALAQPTAPWNPTDEPLVVEHGGYDVEPVDTTGAGDAFTAGAIAVLSADVDSRDGWLADALAFGNAVAALATTSRGAMAALPTREDVERFRGDDGQS